jgi:uncharacterized protein YkwD
MRRAMLRVSRRLLAMSLAGTVAILITVTPGTALASGSGTAPTTTNPPNSPSSSIVETYIRTWLNKDRSLHGLRAMRLDLNLRAIATTRAGTLASLGLLSHTAPGNLSSQLDAAGIRWYGWGEDIGWSSYAWGYDVAHSLYTMWKHSPTHWALMMSSHYNYLGVGLGYRWGNGATYASIVFGELPDETAPTPRLTAAGRTGRDVWFHYTASDTILQSHTAGIRDYDLEYRVDGGSWIVIRTHRTAVSITLPDRARGHSYYLSVRARDRAGNLSGWSSPLHVNVP